MTVSRPCYFGNLLLGVVGVDVNLAYILEDVTYYQDSLASYTFLIDNKGWSHTAGRGGVLNILTGLLTISFELLVIQLNSVCGCKTELGFKSDQIVYMTIG